jgi:predicted RNA-binding protein Jag
MKNEKYVEAEGKTVEEAIETALQILKLPRKRVRIETLSEEKKGLFDKPVYFRIISLSSLNVPRGTL